MAADWTWLYRTGLTAGLLLAVWAGGESFAQEPTPSIAVPGFPIVTGFSGSRLGVPTPPPGVNPVEKTYIDLDGPSLRTVDARNMGGPPVAQVVPAPKPLTVTAAQIGQVFSLALDDAVPPNIYAAATSSYGLSIVVPDADGDGLPDRARRGAANAEFMSGQFGPVGGGGGPGSIWRIDGRTGAVRLFTNVMLDGAPNSGPALGGIAFDPASRQIFGADRDTGVIHRFSLDGLETGRFDHGAQALPAVGLPPVPHDPSKRLDIRSAAFDSENPATWKYAPPARRIFGLTVYHGRLYYAVASGHRIWSVSIGADGSFGSDPRVEYAVANGPVPGTEISEIAFNDEGDMLLAERGPPTGAFDFSALTPQNSGRVVRVRQQQPGADGTPFFWTLVGDYAIGFPPIYQNGDGGIAIGYAYDPRTGIANAGGGACGGTLWSTGSQLRISPDPAIAQRLAPGGPFPIDGLQANAISLLRPENTPPFNSYFIDYDDITDIAGTPGHMGDVIVWRMCGTVPVVAELPVVVPIACPPGLFDIDGVCQIGLACPTGTEYAGGCCVYRGCPEGQIRVRGECRPPPTRCNSDETYSEGRCEAPRCPQGMVVKRKGTSGGVLSRLSNGDCPEGQTLNDGRCQPTGRPHPQTCGTPTYCECPEGTRYNDGTCVPTSGCSGPHMVDIGDNTCACEDGYQLVGGVCIRKLPTCDDSRGPSPECCQRGTVWNSDARSCERRAVNACPRGTVPVNGACCSPELLAIGVCGGRPTGIVPVCSGLLVNGQCCSASDIAAGLCGGTTVRCRPGDPGCPIGDCPGGARRVDGVCPGTGGGCGASQFRGDDGKCQDRPNRTGDRTSRCSGSMVLRNGQCVSEKSGDHPNCRTGRHGRCIGGDSNKPRKTGDLRNPKGSKGSKGSKGVGDGLRRGQTGKPTNLNRSINTNRSLNTQRMGGSGLGGGGGGFGGHRR